jgi:hypothetical protein
MGFFDVISTFFKPVSAPLVSFSTKLSGQLIDTLVPSAHVSEVIATPQFQKTGQDLFAVGAVAGLGIGGAAVAAPMLAGAGVLGGAGSLSGLGASAAGLLPTVLPSLTGDQGVLTEQPQDVFYDDGYDTGE